MAVSLTADMWTSVNTDTFLGVTGHSINEELKPSSVLLGVAKFPQSHTAENLKNAKELLMNGALKTRSVVSSLTMLQICWLVLSFSGYTTYLVLPIV